MILPGLPSSRPLALHPDNPHYFLFRDRPTILITSAEHYGAVLNLDFDFRHYLDELHACGLNHTRLWSGTYREYPGFFGIEENTLAPEPGRYLCPWLRSTAPGNRDGGAKFDLARWDSAYFERLKAFMQEASQRGIVVEMNLFCSIQNDDLWKINPMHAANNVQAIGTCGARDVYTLQHPELTAVQEAVTRQIVRELAGFDNLYYEVCNEPYNGGVTQVWQDHIAKVIVETEQGLPHPHLISVNVANGSVKVEQPNPAISLFNFHYCTPPDVVAVNAGLNKPIGQNETGCRGRDDATYRSEGWDFILSGGALYNNLDYSFSTVHPDGTAQVRNPGGGSRALRQQLKFLKDFIEGFDFLRLSPHPSLLKGDLPKELTARVLAEPGKQYAIYITHAALGLPEPIASTHPTQIELQLELAQGRYQVQWLNPTTGNLEASESLTHPGGLARLRSPVFLEDIALSVKRDAE